MAAGATVPGSSIPAFAALVAERLAAAVGEARLADGLPVDAALTAAGATPGLVRALEQAGPFGAGHPEPVFAFAHHRVVDAMEVGTGHVRVRLRAGDGATLSGIAFRAAEQPLGQALLAARGMPAHVAGTLSIDRWGGGERVSLRVLDVAAAERA